MGALRPWHLMVCLCVVVVVLVVVGVLALVLRRPKDGPSGPPGF